MVLRARRQKEDNGIQVAPKAVMQTSLRSQMQIIESSRIHPFEWPDQDFVSGGTSAIGGQTIRHPFLVSPLENGSYLLLEEPELYRHLTQAGLDHVDGHRTVGLVISPYTKRNKVVSTNYTQINIGDYCYGDKKMPCQLQRSKKNHWTVCTADNGNRGRLVCVKPHAHCNRKG